ncbi:MAG: glycosyltransferase family 87 protein [Leptospirales bacterium]
MSSTAAFRTALNFYSIMMAGFVAGVLAPLLVVLLLLFGLPVAVALSVGVISGAAGFYILVPLVPSGWVDFLRGRSRVAVVFWTLACVFVLMFTMRLGAFMLDPEKKQFSLAPPVEFMVKHTCLSGYLSAAALAELGTENLYILSHYKDPEMQKLMPEVAPLDRDFYAYPPQFLLLPKLMLTLSRDFFDVRAGWYVFYSAAVLISMIGIAFWVGGREGAVLGVLTPVIWISLPTLVNLQLGNIHLLIYVACLGAMIAFEKRRTGGDVLGGALLAFAILAKIFPGILVLYLLLQRRLKPVVWVGVFGLVYSALALAVFGLRPFVDYITYDIPKIASGELFDFVWTFTPAILVNYSPFGIPFKLQLVGLEFADPLAISRVIILVYTALVLGLLVLVSLRLKKREDNGEQGPRFRLTRIVVWLALLALMSYRSPFAPWTYGAVGGVWLFAAFAALWSLKPAHTALLIVGWVLISVYGPPIVVPMVVFSLIAQTILYVSGFWIAAKGSDPAAA